MERSKIEPVLKLTTISQLQAQLPIHTVRAKMKFGAFDPQEMTIQTHEASREALTQLGSLLEIEQSMAFVALRHNTILVSLH